MSQIQEQGQKKHSICRQYRAKKPPSGSRYAAGQKRCQICEIFINYDGLFCPCCNYRLRGRPRNRGYKEKMRIEINNPTWRAD